MPEITRFNLIYHLYPVHSRSITRLDLVWRWNVSQILDRIDLFNGRRIVAVALDHQTVPLEWVEQTFAGQADLVAFHNDPKRGEVATLVPLLERVESRDPREATFYGHAKGVTRNGEELGPILCWADCLYHRLLDFPHEVAQALGYLGRAMYGVRFRAETRWRFPGTFWWFHNASVFGGRAKADWRRPRNVVNDDGDRWAAESFPEYLFGPEAMASSTAEIPDWAGTASLYSPTAWSPLASREGAECTARAFARWWALAGCGRTSG